MGSRTLDGEKLATVCIVALLRMADGRCGTCCLVCWRPEARRNSGKGCDRDANDQGVWGRGIRVRH